MGWWVETLGGLVGAWVGLFFLLKLLDSFSSAFVLCPFTNELIILIKIVMPSWNQLLHLKTVLVQLKK